MREGRSRRWGGASGDTGDVGIVSASFASSAIYWRGLEADHRGTVFCFVFNLIHSPSIIKSSLSWRKLLSFPL